MAQIARGHTSDRPFARTVYALVAKRFTGDLVLQSGPHTYRVSWRDGAVVGADSPDPSDTVARVAVSAGLLPGARLGDVLRVMASGQVDEIDAVVKVGNLDDKATSLLRGRALARRATRVFALEGAELWLDDQPSAPADGARPLDGRWVTFAGVRAHYSDERLTKELSATLGGKAFRLRSEATGVLPAFGFSQNDRVLLEALRTRAHTIEEMSSTTDGKARKRALAAIYALAAASCLSLEDAPARPEPKPAPKAAPKPKPKPAPAAAAAAAPKPKPKPKPKPAAPPASALTDLIRDKLAVIDGGGDHYAVLGVDRTAPSADIQTAYFELARQLHPDRLRAAGITDRGAETAFAVINQAFGVLSNPGKRSDYDKALAGDTSAEDDEAAIELAQRVFAAEEAFRLGEMALRRGAMAEAHDRFAEAVALNPDEGEHHALLAWATYCVATDKEAIARQVRTELRRAISMSPKCVPAYFYRGQIAKLGGQLDTAEECFRKVLELDPTHRDAETELRLLSSRQEKAKKKGLFDRIKGR